MGRGRCAKIWPQLRLTNAASRRAEARGSCQAFAASEGPERHPDPHRLGAELPRTPRVRQVSGAARSASEARRAKKMASLICANVKPARLTGPFSSTTIAAIQTGDQVIR
jgi:hypothetical protein